MATIEKRNFVGMEAVVQSIAADLAANGFDVLNVNDSDSTTIDDASKRILLKPTDVVDPLAVEDSDTGHANFANRQPWRLMLEVDNEEGGFRIWANTPTNVTVGDVDDVVSISKSGSSGSSDYQTSGLLTYKSWDRSTFKEKNVLLPEGKLAAAAKTPSKMYTMNVAYWGFDLEKVDYEAFPMSYRLTITPRGIMCMVWVESRDNAGSSYGWFCIQRMVDSSGDAVISGKAPLFAVFSENGGGGARGDGTGTISLDSIAYDALNAPKPDGISQFVVREQDINAPDVPHSAVMDTADASRIINSVQQVSTSEDNQFILNFPKGLNTQRYSYPHELDLFAYTSADVISQWSETSVTVYGEASPRKYKAMNANHINNKGMRILMLIEGGGV